MVIGCLGYAPGVCWGSLTIQGLISHRKDPYELSRIYIMESHSRFLLLLLIWIDGTLRDGGTSLHEQKLA